MNINSAELKQDSYFYGHIQQDRSSFTLKRYNRSNQALAAVLPRHEVLCADYFTTTLPHNFGVALERKKQQENSYKLSLQSMSWLNCLVSDGVWMYGRRQIVISSFQQIRNGGLTVFQDLTPVIPGEDEKCGWAYTLTSHQILVARKKIIEIFKTSISDQKSPRTVQGNLLFVLLFPMYDTVVEL